MNTAFNSALKQSTAIRKDLSSLSASLSNNNDTAAATSAASHVSPAQMPAAFGALSASLTAFSRTVDEYNSLAKQELNPAKQEKAFDRIRNFRNEQTEYRAELARLKTARDDAQLARDRTELLGRRPYTAAADAAAENPYAYRASTAGAAAPQSQQTAYADPDAAREAHALREQNFFANTNAALDDYIARGQAVLGDLGHQRDMLKNTQKRLYTVGNTLGVSGDTIRMIERRAREDKWIFWAGVVVFFLFCWLCLHYLR